MNIPPNPKTQDPKIQRKLQRQTTDWLNANDKGRKRRKWLLAQQRKRDIQQSTNNTQLIASRQKALHLR